MDRETRPDVAPTMDTPVACVIRLQGTLAPETLARLGGLRLVAVGGDSTWSELRGELCDQGALHRVLTVLHRLGLPLLGVACTPIPHRPSLNGVGTL
jgi:hypothetical protein